MFQIKPAGKILGKISKIKKYNHHLFFDCICTITTKQVPTCLLTIFSTVDRFKGAEVEFNISFVSWPVYTTIPKIHGS